MRATILLTAGALLATNMAAFKPEKKLWAAMAVSQPVFVLGVKEQVCLHVEMLREDRAR